MDGQTPAGLVSTMLPVAGRHVSWFLRSAGLLLYALGIAKIWTGLGDTRVMAVIDPIVGIQFGHLLLAVGVAELIIAAFCLLTRRWLLATALIAWLSTNFLVYRLGLWWMDWKSPCGCLGNLTDVLHISPQTADNISKVLLVYLLIGSYGLFTWQWRRRSLEMGCVQAREAVRRAPGGTSLLLCWVVAGIGFLPQQGLGGHFKIEGQLKASFYKPDGSLQTTQSFGFVAEVDREAPQWILRTYFSEHRDWYYEITGIGSDTFSVHYNPNVNRSWNMPATVYPGDFPAMHFYPVVAPWLAFCSAHFIAGTGGTNIPFFFFNVASEPEAHVIETEVSLLSSGSPALPSEIRWRVTEERIKSANESPWLRAPLSESEARDRIRDLRYKFKMDSEVGRYVVTARTNIQGVELPLSFSVRKTGHLRLKDKSSRAVSFELLEWKEYLHALLEGSVDRIEWIAGEMLRPAFPKPVDVGDYRLNDMKRGVGFVHYTITNGHWRTNIDEEMLGLLRKQTRNTVSLLRQPQKSRSNLVRITLVVVGLLPLVIFAARKWSCRNSSS